MRTTMPFFVDVEATRFRGERFPVESTTGPRRASTCPASPVTLGPSPMITSVRLEGFKNFRDATLHLGPLTVIVGTNASGKSNIRDAFRFLHGMGRGYSLAEIIGEKYVEGGVLVWRGIRGGVNEVGFNQTEVVRIRTSIQMWDVETLPGLDTSTTHEISVNLSDHRTGPKVMIESLREPLSTWPYASHGSDDPPEQEGPPYLFVRLPRDGQNRKHGKRLRFLDSRPVLSQVCESMDVPERYRDPARKFLKSLESMRFLDLSPDAMKVPSVPGQIILGDRGENLSSVLQAICNDDDTKRAMIEWVRQLTPLDVSDFDFVPDQTGRVLLTLIESTGRRTSAYSASDGTLRFLAIIAALMGPARRSSTSWKRSTTGFTRRGCHCCCN